MKSKIAAALLVTVLALVLIITPAGANGMGAIVNGSFETGDYTGWTLTEDSGSPTSGTWGIASSGETIHPGDSTYDFCDKLMVRQGSPGLPITYASTEGNYLAYQLQNMEENHRMYQDITLSPFANILAWDMWYTNWEEEFIPGEQYLAVHIRDLADNILETLFITTQGVNPQSITMTGFSYDISAYAGTTVRLDIEMAVQDFYIDAAFDNFRITPVLTPGISQWGIIATATLFGSAIVWVIWRRQSRSEIH
jgi:hypothetical protein